MSTGRGKDMQNTQSAMPAEPAKAVETTADQEVTPNSDIRSLPGSSKDAQIGVDPLTPEQQLVQLNNFFEDNYPDIFVSLTSDEGAEYTLASKPVPPELKQRTERLWARVPDLLTHSSQLVLGAGLDHAMPHVAFTRAGIEAKSWQDLMGAEADLPDGVTATVLAPTEDAAVKPSGKVAVALHGGPGWFGDGKSHDQFWQPLFAALAQQSGVTVVDVTYPLPGDLGWGSTRTAVADVVWELKNKFGEIGAIVFGSGFGAVQVGLDDIDWLVALSPRIPESAVSDVGNIEVLVSLATEDSRATPETKVREYFDRSGAKVDYQLFLGEHVIATPEKWRERVQAAGEWIARR